jgi:hypothetical protein
VLVAGVTAVDAPAETLKLQAFVLHQVDRIAIPAIDHDQLHRAESGGAPVALLRLSHNRGAVDQREPGGVRGVGRAGAASGEQKQERRST